MLPKQKMAIHVSEYCAVIKNSNYDTIKIFLV